MELELAALEGCFSSVVLELPLLAAGGVLLDGAEELDEDEDGVLLEPAPAEPLGVPELDGAVIDEDEDDPPLAWSFLLRSIEVDEELELGGVAVVPPADDEDDEPGAVVAPEGAVVEDELDERSVPRSHAAISDAPSARETATAIVDNLMWPPWLGYRNKAARIGPRLLRLNPWRVSAASVPHSGFCVTALRASAVAPLLKVAMLAGLFGIDLALDRIRAILFLGGCRRADVRRCRGRSCSRLRNRRQTVGFWRRRCHRLAIATRGQRQ